MSAAHRLPDYLQQMFSAAGDACAFVEGLKEADFLEDKRTQQAVVMSILILGEAATKVADRYPDFTAACSNIPWHSMRGMRNRIAHGYFDIDMQVVWSTVTDALPSLLEHLPLAIEMANRDESNDGLKK